MKPLTKHDIFVTIGSGLEVSLTKHTAQALELLKKELTSSKKYREGVGMNEDWKNSPLLKWILKEISDSFPAFQSQEVEDKND